MSNEEINEYIEDLLTVACCPGHDYSCKQVYEYVKQLENENQQLKKEKSSLMTALNTSREKYNNDKARYRRKYKTLKKQKDDVVEYIQNTDDFDIEIFDESTGGCLGYDLSEGAKNILRMLGEIDEIPKCI